MKEKLMIAAVATLLAAGCAAGTEGLGEVSESSPPETVERDEPGGYWWLDASGEVREWPVRQWEPPPPSELEGKVGKKVAEDNTWMGAAYVRGEVETSCQAEKFLEDNGFQQYSEGARTRGAYGDAASQALAEEWARAEAQMKEDGRYWVYHFKENMDALGYHCTAEEIEAILRENLQQDTLISPG